MVPAPADTDQVAAVDCPAVVPVTVAVKVAVPPVRMEAVPGVTLTAMTGAAVTVTVAEPLLVASAALVATTWQVAPAFGAVYVPVAEIDPQLDPSWTRPGHRQVGRPGHRGREGVRPARGNGGGRGGDHHQHRRHGARLHPHHALAVALHRRDLAVRAHVVGPLGRRGRVEPGRVDGAPAGLLDRPGHLGVGRAGHLGRELELRAGRDVGLRRRRRHDHRLAGGRTRQCGIRRLPSARGGEQGSKGEREKGLAVHLSCLPVDSECLRRRVPSPSDEFSKDKVWPLALRCKPLKRQGFLPSSPYSSGACVSFAYHDPGTAAQRVSAISPRWQPSNELPRSADRSRARNP